MSNGPKARLASSVSKPPSIKKEHFNEEQQPAKEEPLNEKQPPIKKEPISEKAQPTKAANSSNPETNRPVPKPSARPKRAPKVRHIDESLLTTKYAPRSLEDIVGNQNNIRNLYNWLLQWDASHSSSSNSFLSFFHRRSLLI